MEEEESESSVEVKSDVRESVEKEPSEKKEEEEEEEIDPRTLLTKEQVQYFKDIFDSIDTQKKEKIPSKTISFVLRSMGLNPTKAEIKKRIEEIDPEHTGSINFQSFLLPIARKINDVPETHEDLIAAFETLDDDEKGFLTVHQVSEYLTSLGEDLEDFEIEILLKMAESKGTGKIHYQEFVEKMMGIVHKGPKKDKKKGGKKKEKGRKKERKKEEEEETTGF